MDRSGVLSISVATVHKYIVAGMALFFLLLSGMPRVLAHDEVAPPGTVYGVVYPEIREPYRGIFESIVKGVVEEAGVPVKTLALEADADVSFAGQWLERNHIGAVVCLGNRARSVMTPLKQRMPMLIGGLMSSTALQQEDWHGVVLNPHPATLFDQLKKFVPRARRIHVVYGRESDDWLMDLAEQAAKARDMTLIKHLVWDSSEAAREFERIIGEMNGQTEAIWLIQDHKIIDRNTLLPFILKQSWERSVPVFSSTPNHVERGALFSVFPDHRAIGRRLARRLTRILAGQGNDDPPLEAVREVKLVVNLRTLEHLGIRLSNEERERIELTFPDR